MYERATDIRQYSVTLGNMMLDGVLLALGRTTGAKFGFLDFWLEGRRCFGHTLSIRSRSLTNFGRTTCAPNSDEETSNELDISIEFKE